MNIIANTGIQLFNFPFEINLNDNFKMFFHEWFDTEETQLKLEIAHLFPEEEIWVKKHDLSFLGYAPKGRVTDEWENIKDDFEAEGYSPINIDTERPEDSGCFQQSLSRIKWDKFENTWYPMPFFQLKGKKSEFGPTNWCRFKLIPIEINGKVRKYNLLLAFDTKSVFEEETFEDEALKETPVFSSTYEQEKEFSLCNDEYKLISYCSEEFNCNWVDKYLLKQFHNVNNINDLRGIKPKLNYLSQFIFLIKYIEQSDILPKITLFSNQHVAYENVDLVVDIGNSRTCAVLFDNGDFKKMSPLELQDFSTPVLNEKLNKYRDSFDMRLAFREADFGGKFGILNSKQFVFPSMIRLGKEANQLIHKATNLNTGSEKTSTFSSPKRFLWDTKPQKQEWEFIRLEGEESKPIFIEGITQQLNFDGTLNTNGEGGISMHYSRRGLMTFAFLEILAQANLQINSYQQRNHWGNETLPRQVRRIIVTCPTAMSRVEQVSLRKCAEDAAIILDRFFKQNFLLELDEKEAREKIQVIPSAKNLSLKDEAKEWIYDEATAAQFVFLYAEVHQRYMKNVREYFDFYGKVRNDLGGYNKKSLTIGSVDIGAGTTDVMIAAYKHDEDEQCILTPVPLFWESFYLAGDDLLKELIQQLVIEGKYSPIERKLKALDKNPVELLQPFLGTDNGVSFRNRQLRSDFNLQVSVPIILSYLELLKEDKIESQILTFNDIFINNPPTLSVLNHFKQHFGFELESLQWQYEKKIVSTIVEKTFDSLTGKISSLLSYYACDIVLLSGRPTSLKSLTDLFLKHYAISPNRLKTMNDYRVGRWYPEDKRFPFIDGNGKFLNPKSIITTGAMIGYIAENGGMKGFKLNLQELKNKLLPTTHFFGILNEKLTFTRTIISPEVNNTEIEVSYLPFRIGVKQLNISSYPSRPFYTLDFDDYKFEDRVKGRLDDENDFNSVQKEIDFEKKKIFKKMPLKITISREIAEDIELLRIEEIKDKEGNNLSKNFFALNVQSMSELENFWLDSGIFSLNVNN
ncbi:MAG: virulence factor SrfB [Algoriphagus aquaeductus]|uniref:virulence factor SrfB n=1 Tax=Algoriphagus aquaeductus TaxID=475299 RepID=UPI0039190129